MRASFFTGDHGERGVVTLCPIRRCGFRHRTKGPKYGVRGFTEDLPARWGTRQWAIVRPPLELEAHHGDSPSRYSCSPTAVRQRHVVRLRRARVGRAARI